jgi:hypothetical protein
LEHLCEIDGFPVELWRGDFDNYISEIMDTESGLYAFSPQVVLLMPSEHRCCYSGPLTDSREAQQAAAHRIVNDLLAPDCLPVLLPLSLLQFLRLLRHGHWCRRIDRQPGAEKF